MNYSLDVGQNLTSIGFAFLFLKYLMPVIIGLILLAVAYFGIKKLLEILDIELNQTTLLTILGILMIIAVLILA